MKAIARIRWLSSSLAILLAGLLSFSSRLEQAVSLDWARGLFAMMDQLKYELMAVLVLVLFWQWIQRQLHKAWAQCVIHWRTGHRSRLALWLVTLLIGTAAGLYQLAWYYVGKSELYLERYENKLLYRAYRAFEGGNAAQARQILGGCNYVLLAADCKTALDRLDERLGEAESIYSYFEDEYPLWSPAWLEAPGVVFRYDRSKSRREELSNLVRTFYVETRATYGRAVAAAESGEWQRARGLFDDVAGRFPWFGDAHLIAAEIDSRLQSGDTSGTPYLAALQRMGAGEFTRVMTNPWMLDLQLLDRSAE
jgi:hypothetical protein